MTGRHKAVYRPLFRRVFERIDASGDCWEWMGFRDVHGYGRLHIRNLEPVNGKRRHLVGHVHRVVWELLVGPIPDGLVLDHLCRNPPCANPDHLEPVTQRVNLLRSRRLTCRRGHLQIPANRHTSRTGRQRCLPCRDAYNAARPGRSKEGRLAA